MGRTFSLFLFLKFAKPVNAKIDFAGWAACFAGNSLFIKEMEYCFLYTDFNFFPSRFPIEYIVLLSKYTVNTLVVRKNVKSCPTYYQKYNKYLWNNMIYKDKK